MTATTAYWHSLLSCSYHEALWSHLDDLSKGLGQRQRRAGNLCIWQRVVVEVPASECGRCKGK